MQMTHGTLAMKTFLFAIAAMLTVNAWSQPSATESFVDQLAPLTALRGGFVQTQLDADGQLLGESRGRFSVQRPGLLHWQTEQPFPQLLVTNGVSVWLYDEDLEQVTVSSVSDQLDQTPAVIFSGDLAKIDEQFSVSSVSASHYQLTPRDAGSVYQSLDVKFEGEVLKSMKILDGFGQETLFELSTVEIVSPMPVSYFQFEAPAGTDVLIHD